MDADQFQQLILKLDAIQTTMTDIKYYCVAMAVFLAMIVAFIIGFKVAYK